MKKIFNPSETPKKEGQEQSKKLYRSISEQVRRLDDARSCARYVGDLFTLSLEVQRSKFRDYCERLIFSDPILYGRKGEELLWRKGFYDVISTAKRLKRKDYSSEDKANIQAHINTGIGYYHNFILKLQNEFDISLDGILDFPLLKVDDKPAKCAPGQLLENIELSIHRSLVYLGDLCRYRLEIYPNWDPSLAFHYYNQALYFKPDYGMPHNQIGTFVSSLNLNYSLDAAYCYIRCLTSKYPFEGTENNLTALFEKNAKYLEQLPIEDPDADCIIEQEPAEHIKRFISRFLLLTDIWLFNKNVPHIYDLCHQTNVDLRECLSYNKPLPSENGDTQTEDSIENESISSPSYLHHGIVFKIVVICLLCISRLQSNQSAQLSNVIAFTLAVYSQLITHVTTHVQEEVVNLPLPPPEEPPIANGCLKKTKKKSKKMKSMRRRKNVADESDESDLSDAEVCNDSDDSSSGTSLISDNEDVLVSSEDDEEEVDGTNGIEEKNVKNELQNHGCKVTNAHDTDRKDMEILKKARRMDNELIDIFADQVYLQSIKAINDWLSIDADVLKLCGKSTRSLFGQMIKLINVMHIDHKSVLSKKSFPSTTDIKLIPLPEDVTLKGVQLLANMQKTIDWKSMDNVNLSTKEETVIRMMKFVSFGRYLTTVNGTGVTFNDEEKLFMVRSKDKSESPISLQENIPSITIQNGHVEKKGSEESTNGQLSKMKHMGQLWLAAEVKDLENRVKDKTSLSPYLVVDADALIKHTSTIKNLINSKKFIVLVPTAVVSALDEMKKERSEAREAIRWLEHQFQQGNRFFRAQRHKERLPIPFIKYPKKKDKESNVFIQIIECCHYLAQQQKTTANLVTLLMGNNNVKNNEKEISYSGLAKSAGVNLESVTDFFAKWKKINTKGKR